MNAIDHNDGLTTPYAADPVTPKPHGVPSEPDELYEGGLVPHGNRAWVLIKAIGTGSVGEVWLARNKDSGETWAYKFCKDADKARHLRFEAHNLLELSKQLDKLKPGIRQHISLLRDTQLELMPCWLAFDYIDGDTLKSFMASAGAMDWRTAWALFKPLLEDMTTVHNLGVIHRDLKPANILLTQDLRPHITDFGISKVKIDVRGGGTLPYSPPEQLHGQEAHTADDVYALGMILWEMLAGLSQPPYKDHIDRLKVPAQVKAAIHSCLLSCDTRPTTAGILLQQLKRGNTRLWLYITLLLAVGSLAAWRLPWQIGYKSNTIYTAPIPPPPPLTIHHVAPDAGTAVGRFIKLGTAGQELPDKAKAWSCIRDTATGLMWEIKTADGGLRDQAHTYAWHGFNSPSPGNTTDPTTGDGCSNQGSCDTADYVSAVNRNHLCGASDWRIPEREELRSIVDYQLHDPAIDTDWFPNTLSSQYWSASLYAPDATPDFHSPWYVDFAKGFDNGINLNADKHHVRLVRTEQ